MDNKKYLFWKCRYISFQKKYLEDRKIEIFELIKMSSIIDTWETYTKIKNLIYESYICKWK